MKVVHCIFSFNTGGAETMLIDIVNEQCKTAEVTLIVVNRSYERALIDRIDRRVGIVLLNRRPGSRSPWPILRLNMLLLRLQPDAVHCHQTSLASIMLSVWKKLFLTVHDVNIPIIQFHRFKSVFAISDAVKNDIIERGYSHVVTVFNGIDVAAINVREDNDRHTPLRIVQVGRLDKDKKGQDILIEAVATLKKRGNSDITVDFIGEGASLAELQNLVSEYGLEQQIHFLGLRDRNYIYAHLKDYDLMCHGSRYEGFGLTVAEAMAARLPVLVSTGDGPFEVIGRGLFGHSFSNGDAEDCADKIAEIYGNYTDTLKVVDFARQHVIENYSIGTTAKNYLKSYICGTTEK